MSATERMWSEPNPGDTVARQWDLFSKCLYPIGMTPEQQRQIKQAFYSGAWIAFTLAAKISELPEDTAVAEMEKVFQEAESFCRHAAEIGRARRRAN